MILAVLLASSLGFQQPVEASSRRAPAVDRAAHVDVILKSSALIRGTDVLIGDLVTIEPAGPLATHIAGLTFGNPPTFGFVRRATAHEIRTRIAAQGVDISRLDFDGPSTVAITSTFREVKVTELQGVTDAVLDSVLERQPGEEIEYALDDTKTVIRVPPGRSDLEYQARVRPGSISTTGAIIDVTFIVDGVPSQKVALRYKLDRYQYVVKAARSIRQGEPLDAGNLVRSREKVSASRGFYATELNVLAGLVARRDMQKGRMVSINDGVEPAMIRAGDIVEVIANSGNVEITMSAKAITSGSQREAITVQALGTNRSFRAIVIAPGIAAVGGSTLR